MLKVHQLVLDHPGASPFWTPDPSGSLGLQEELARQTTSLHEAARRGRYELLSMLLHHCRGRGLLPGACLIADGNGEQERVVGIFFVASVVFVAVGGAVRVVSYQHTSRPCRCLW